MPSVITLPRRGQSPPTQPATPATPGGIGAPADLPARVLVDFPPGHLGPGGAFGLAARPRRRPSVDDWDLPFSGGVSFRPTPIAHRLITFVRRPFANIAGAHSYREPTDMPSWTANQTTTGAVGATDPVPFSSKRQTFTYRRTFGADRQLFAAYRPEIIQPPLPATITRRGAGQKMNPGYFNLLTQYARARSFGSTTVTLPTAPSTPTAQTATFGAY